MQFKEDPRNLIVPLELTKIIYSEWDAEQTILDRPDQVYGKALHGTGKVKFKNGNNYEGEFHNGMLHGLGKFTWVSGVVYEGNFTYNKVSGVGTYSWPDGSIFNGNVLNGLRHGEGRFVASGESAIYEGQWLNGLRHGQGKVIFKSGAFYEGNFSAGNKHGQGKMTYPSQNFYDGTFNNDKKSGYGTMQWLSSSEKYYGDWQDNMQNGWGTHIWIEPKGEGSKFLRNRYEGEWENGERCGVGVFYYANGAKYIGEWHNNLKSGYAIFITDSGGIILGVFKSDRLSQVFATTENEQRSGILPREIAPKTKEEQDVLQDQITRAGNNASAQKVAKNDPKKQQVKEMTATVGANKLIGINAPNSVTNQQERLIKGQIEINPYTYMIDLSDLFRGQNADFATIEQNVQTILLRHNSTLKQFYKFFATKFDGNLSEDTFSLNLEGFWKIVRDAKLLNPNYSLVQLNRLYQNGIKNQFPLNYIQSLLRKQVECIKKYGKKLNLNEIDDVFHMDHSHNLLEILRVERLDYDKLDQQQDVLGFDTPIVDIHDPSTILLFRHFVEMIVRISYLKYGSLNELHRAIEKIIVNKITPLYERKKGKGLNQSEDESRSIQAKTNKINFEDYLTDLQPLFDLISRTGLRPQLGHIDKTVELQDIFKLLEAANMITDVDKTFIAAHIEKYFDADEGTLNQISQLDQSSMQQVTAKDEKPKRRKQKDHDTSHGGVDQKDSGLMKNLNKIEKWITYLHNEFILYDFGDIIITLLVRRNKDLLHPKEEEQFLRVRNMISRLLSIQTKQDQKPQQPRVWPKTLKDQQYNQYQYTRKNELTNIRGQQEAKAKQKKLNEEERKKEDRERNMMALEDQDFKSEEEDEGKSEDSDY